MCFEFLVFQYQYRLWTFLLLSKSSAAANCLQPGLVQWGFEYWTSLVFKWLKVVQLPNSMLFECHLNTKLNLDVSIIQMFVIQIPTVLRCHSKRQTFSETLSQFPSGFVFQ